MQFRFACFSAGTLGLAALFVGLGCAEGEEITSRSGAAGRVGQGGAGGASGMAGSDGTETGGAGGSGATGSGGTGAVGGGGSGGAGGTGAGAGAGGKGGSGAGGGGRGGSGGSTGGSGGSTGGSGGATGGTGGSTGGSGGSTGGSGGATGGTGGLGGTGGVGGSTDGGGLDGATGSCPGGVSYCADFERDLAGAMPSGWTRVGGSDGDWQVTFVDSSNVFAQNHASSSTFRLCYPNGASGAPWNGATTVSARVKLLVAGSSGTTTALLCLGYRTGSGGSYGCLALEQGAGARIRMYAGSSPTDGPLWPAPITIGTWYDVKISMDASGALSAYLGGNLLGAYMPASAISGGYVAVATQSAQAAFDTVMVTQP
jgi:hypothetical protein